MLPAFLKKDVEILSFWLLVINYVVNLIRPSTNSSLAFSYPYHSEMKITCFIAILLTISYTLGSTCSDGTQCDSLDLCCCTKDGSACVCRQKGNFRGRCCSTESEAWLCNAVNVCSYNPHGCKCVNTKTVCDPSEDCCGGKNVTHEACCDTSNTDICCFSHTKKKAWCCAKGQKCGTTEDDCRGVPQIDLKPLTTHPKYKVSTVKNEVMYIADNDGVEPGPTEGSVIIQ